MSINDNVPDARVFKSGKKRSPDASRIWLRGFDMDIGDPRDICANLIRRCWNIDRKARLNTET